jgi:GAF domain-containing protein
MSRGVEQYPGLTAGLAGLLAMIAGNSPLEELLEDVAVLAKAATPGANGAGVTMLESGYPDTIAASETFVRDVDAIQYRLGEGPCVSAAAEGRTKTSTRLGDDAAWPTFGPQAAALGIHSALSLPLIANGEVIGALNLYAREREAFDEYSRYCGEQFAGPAAIAIRNARTLEQAQRKQSNLEVALTSLATIDQAVGIIRSRSGLSAEEAFLRLRIISQHEHIKLNAVASQLVKDAVRRAQSHAQANAATGDVADSNDAPLTDE